MNLTQEQQINKELVEHLNRVKRELAAERIKAKKLLEALHHIAENLILGSIEKGDIFETANKALAEYNKNS